MKKNLVCLIIFIGVSCLIINAKSKLFQEFIKIQDRHVNKFIELKSDTFLCYIENKYYVYSTNSERVIVSDRDTISYGIYETDSLLEILTVCSFRESWAIVPISSDTTKGLVKINSCQFGSKDSVYVSFKNMISNPILTYCLVNNGTNETIYCNTSDQLSSIVLSKDLFISFEDWVEFKVNIYPKIDDWLNYDYVFSSAYYQGYYELHTLIAKIDFFYLMSNNNCYEFDMRGLNERYFRERILSDEYIINYNFDSLKWDGSIYHRVLD